MVEDSPFDSSFAQIKQQYGNHNSNKLYDLKPVLIKVNYDCQ